MGSQQEEGLRAPAVGERPRENTSGEKASPGLGDPGFRGASGEQKKRCFLPARGPRCVETEQLFDHRAETAPRLDRPLPLEKWVKLRRFIDTFTLTHQSPNNRRLESA